MKSRLLTSIAGVALMATAPLAANAQSLNLYSNTPQTFSGTGIGTVATLLTLSSQGNSTTETGCVSYNGTTDVLGAVLTSGACTGTSADLKTGASQTNTQLLSALGITNSSQFGLLLNATEPGGNGITVNALTATFYNASGTAIGTAPLVGTPVAFANTQTGVGNSGYLFTLSGGDASWFASGVRVGLAASLGDATGGNDTFFLVNAGGLATVPEPSTYALLATGLVGLVAVARRRRLV